MQTVTPHRRTAEDHFEVVIRLRQSRNSQPSDATLRLRAQALLKDILMSRLEMEAEINAHEYVHTRGFGDLGRALAASRALQLAFEGFRSAVPPHGRTYQWFLTRRRRTTLSQLMPAFRSEGLA